MSKRATGLYDEYVKRHGESSFGNISREDKLKLMRDTLAIEMG